MEAEFLKTAETSRKCHEEAFTQQLISENMPNRRYEIGWSLQINSLCVCVCVLFRDKQPDGLVTGLHLSVAKEGVTSLVARHLAFAHCPFLSHFPLALTLTAWRIAPVIPTQVASQVLFPRETEPWQRDSLPASV